MASIQIIIKLYSLQHLVQPQNWLMFKGSCKSQIVLCMALCRPFLIRNTRSHEFFPKKIGGFLKNIGDFFQNIGELFQKLGNFFKDWVYFFRKVGVFFKLVMGKLINPTYQKCLHKALVL